MKLNYDLMRNILEHVEEISDGQFLSQSYRENRLSGGSLKIASSHQRHAAIDLASGRFWFCRMHPPHKP